MSASMLKRFDRVRIIPLQDDSLSGLIGHVTAIVGCPMLYDVDVRSPAGGYVLATFSRERLELLPCEVCNGKGEVVWSFRELADGFGPNAPGNCPRCQGTGK